MEFVTPQTQDEFEALARSLADPFLWRVSDLKRHDPSI